MRTLIGTLLAGGVVVASPALAQQHPWVPSDVYTATLAYGHASQHHYNVYRGARGSASIQAPVRPVQPQTTFHAISAMP